MTSSSATASAAPAAMTLGTPEHSKASARIAFIFSVISFRLVLDFCYVFYLVAALEDDPITPMLLNIDAVQLLVSYLLVLLVASIVSFSKTNLNGVFFLAALAFLYVPMTSMVGLNADRSLSTVGLTGLAILTSWAVVSIGTPRLVGPLPRGGFIAASAVSSAVVVVFIIWSVLSGAIYQGNANIDEIYQYREAASSVLDPGIMAYVNVWAQKVFNPFLLAIGFFRRKRLLVVICIALQFYFFFVTQHRTHLFVPVMVCLVYLLYSRNISIAQIYFLMALGLLSTLAISAFFNLEDVPLIVIRRAFFVAASVTLDWVAYFQDHPHVYFADNLLQSYVYNQYTAQVLPLLMSWLVFGGPEFGFNAGLVGVGFAQLGIVGIVLYAGLFGFYVRLVNSIINNGVPVFLAAAILFEPIRGAWADSDLPTVFLSHGLLVAFLLLWIYGKGGTGKDAGAVKLSTLH